jgi:serine/threonine protein kinase
MSVEPSEAMREAWTALQGQRVNDTFPLGRFLGGSEHGGVFLTRSPADESVELAIKLIPTSRALAELHLPRLKRASTLRHPHLLRLLEWGGWQSDGMPFMYAVMPFADQTLADLLTHRALTEAEAREMLPPLLEALAFLHSRNLVHGQLKPTNVLVVGDQVTLASDTIRRSTDGPTSSDAPSIYESPEVRDGRRSAEGDIWALGITLCEALSRRQPTIPRDPREPVAVPEDFSPAFREVVTHCLNRRPEERPTPGELLEWARGSATTFVPNPRARPATPEPAPNDGVQGSAPPAAAATAPTRDPAPPPGPSAGKSSLAPVVIGAIVVLALAWGGVRLLRNSPRHAPVPEVAAASSVAPPSDVRAPVAQIPAADIPAAPVTAPPAVRSAGVHQVIPEVPLSARRTIRGHIKVWVRAFVDPDGSVSAAVADRAGPSGYFERIAIDAAKKWTFPAVDSAARRLMQVRFDFSHEGTTASAVSLH